MIVKAESLRHWPQRSFVARLCETHHRSGWREPAACGTLTRFRYLLLLRTTTPISLSISSSARLGRGRCSECGHRFFTPAYEFDVEIGESLFAGVM
jgi:hypothetical protein